MSLMFLFRLYATIGMSGYNTFSFGSFSMRYQCRLSICPMWVVLLLYGMLNIGSLRKDFNFRFINTLRNTTQIYVCNIYYGPLLPAAF